MEILLDFSTAAQDEYLFNYSFYKCIIKPLENFDVKINIILPEGLYNRIKNKPEYNKHNLIPHNLNYYEQAGLDFIEVCKYLYTGKEILPRYHDAIKTMYQKMILNINPDIIIPFEFGNCILKELLPEALHLTYLGGLWKSIPPDFSIVFDPINSVSYSSLVQFKDKIRAFKINAAQDEKINKLKEIFKQRIINTHIARNALLKYKKQYNKLILLPLQLQGYMYELESDFKSQEEYFEYVMQRIPENIGVIVTGHHACMESIKILLQNKNYPNAIVIPELFRGVIQSSLFVLPYIDAMINVCSSLVLKALLCDVRIISLGKNYNIWCEDFADIENIVKKLNAPKNNKNNILYWYLTHYDFPTKLICSQNWLYNYFKKLLTKSGEIDFDYFEEFCDIDYVINYYTSVKYNKRLDRHTKCKLVQQIFSVINEGEHKVWTILGIKMKFRRRHNEN